MDFRVGQQRIKSLYTAIWRPYLEESSAESSCREEQTAVTSPSVVALIAGMCALATQP